MRAMKALVAAFLLCLTASCGTPAPATPAPPTATIASTGTSTAVMPPPPVPAQPSQNVETILSGGAELASDFGLKMLPAAEATIAATGTIAAVTAIQTTLGGSNAGDSAAVQALLSTKLLSGVAAYDNVIQGALSSLLVYLPAPTVGQKLSAVELGYINAFLSGLSKGCSDFLAAPAAPVKSPVYRAILAARAVKKSE